MDWLIQAHDAATLVIEALEEGDIDKARVFADALSTFLRKAEEGESAA